MPKVKEDNVVLIGQSYIFKVMGYCHPEHTLKEMKEEGYFEPCKQQFLGVGIIHLCDGGHNYEQCAIMKKNGKIFLKTFINGKASAPKGKDKVEIAPSKYNTNPESKGK